MPRLAVLAWDPRAARLQKGPSCEARAAVSRSRRGPASSASAPRKEASVMRNRRNPRSFSSSSTSTLAWAALAAGALLIGLPGRAAFAAQPATADEARAMAAQCGEQAAQLRASAAAGAAFKAGLIQRDEACAAR